MGRPREHDERTRERLLEAAEHVSAAEGWDAVTIRRVAREAGTSTRAVYALFDSKEGLEQALHEAMFARLRELLVASPASDDPRGDLLGQALAYRHWAIESPQRYAIAMHRFLGPRSGPRSARGLAVARAALAELQRAVGRCRAAGLLGTHDPDEVVLQLRVLVHGLAEFENIGLLGPDPEAAWRAATEALVDGLGHARRAAA
jgi:AcrR family transcriptional regulator